MYKFILFALFSLFLLSGCNLIDKYALSKGYRKADDISKEITSIKEQHAKDVTSQQAALMSKYDSLLASLNQADQSAANALYGADFTYRTISKPSRTDVITNNFVTEGWAALGNKMPDYETMKVVNERVKRELDETQTSMAQLMAAHSQVIEQNKVLASNVDKKSEELTTLKNAIKESELKYNQALAVKQGDLNVALGKINELERQRADDKEQVAATKWKMISVVGVLSLICAAGAIWSPVWKSKFIIASVVLGIVALGINFIQPWMLGAAAGAAILLVAIYVVYEHHKADKALTGVVGAVQSVKDGSKEVYDTYIRTALDEWLTKYDKTGNKVPDKAAQSVIETKLMENNLK
jgi:hypothetical protein